MIPTPFRLSAVGLLITHPAAAAEAITFCPNWFPAAQFAGVYVALDRVYYRDAGLDVTLGPIAYSQKPPALHRLEAACVDLGLMTVVKPVADLVVELECP